jgi:hypothetical protein
MKNHDFIIEQILMDAKAGQMVDESAWSKLKGWGAAAAKTAQNIGTGVSNLRKSAKAGWKNTMGKLAGGATHDAAKAEASAIKKSRDAYEDAGAYGKKVDRAQRIKEAGVKRQKEETRKAAELKKLAKKALDAVQAYLDAGGKLMHGRTSSARTTIKSLQQAAGMAEEASQPTQNWDGQLAQVPGVDSYSAEWEETIF